MNALLDKFGLSREKSEAAEAKRRKQEEDQLEAELQEFVQQAPNAKSLQVALRTTAAPPTSYVMSEGTSSSVNHATELEHRIVECFRSLHQLRRTRIRTPVKLVRLLLARYEDHLSDPATRLPVAVEALHTVMATSSLGMQRFVELGTGKALVKTLEVIIEEMELRTQLHNERRLSTPPSQEERSRESNGGGGDGDDDDAQLIAPLYRLAKYGMQCMSSFVEDTYEGAAPSGDGASSLSFSLPWKTKKKDKKNSDNPTGTSPTSAGSVPTAAFAQLINVHSQLPGLVTRLFGLQCRCTLPAATQRERDAVRDLFQTSCRVMAVFVSMEKKHVRGVFEGAGIQLLRAQDATDHASGHEIELLAQSGVMLSLVARCLQQWPTESCQQISDTMFANHFGCALRSCVLSHPFDELALLEQATDSEDAAREALEHFFSDTYAGRHWRDMADALQLDTSRIVTAPSPRTTTGTAAFASIARSQTAWLDGLNAFMASLRASRDSLTEAAYRKKGSDKATGQALDVISMLETALVDSFRTTSTTSVSLRKGATPSVLSPTTSAPPPLAMYPQSSMHRWLITYVASLFPLHPQQVRPPERSRVIALHRLVKSCGFLEYVFTDPNSGWCSTPLAQTERLGLVSICVRYLLLVEDTSSPSPGVPAARGPVRSPTTTATGLPSSATVPYPVCILGNVLESLEHYSHALANRESSIAAIVPLCALIRWGMICKEHGTTELLTEACATQTLCSSASALARHLSTDDGTIEGQRKVCRGLETVVETLDFLLSFRLMMQFQLRHEPAALLQLMVHAPVRHRAGTLVQKLLCYEPDADESDHGYQLRMSNLVTDLWDITTNSREVPDEVYLAILECVRIAVDKAFVASPFLQTKLQNAICSNSFAADCFLRLVHPLNAGWHTLDRSTGRSAVLATMSSLIRANPVQRHRLATTVGETQLVKAATMSCGNGRIEVSIVDELLAVVFEDVWRRPGSSSNIVAKGSPSGLSLSPTSSLVSVQNANILEALLIHLGEVLRDCDTVAGAATPLAITSSGTESLPAPVVEAGDVVVDKLSVIREEAVACLLRVVERLRVSFARCRASVWACATHHVFEHLVHLLPYLREPHHIAAMENCLSLLTARHISIRQLKRLLGVLSHASSVSHRRLLLPCVIEILHAACHTHIHSRGEPKNYIALRSRSGPAGLSMTFAQFPKNGYTLSLWLRWEGPPSRSDTSSGSIATADAHDSSGEALATLMSLSEPNGGDTTFRVDLARDGSLVVCQTGPSGSGGRAVSSPSLFGLGDAERSTIHILEGHQVQSQQWFHVVFTHKTAMFGPGEIVAFINGRELRGVKAPYPTAHANGALSMVIGSTAETIQGRLWTTPLHGQLNAVYVFNKVLNNKEVGELYGLGANHATCFLPSERVFAAKASTLYDGNIGERVVVCIDPRLSEKGMLFNAANVAKIAASSRSLVAAGGLTTAVSPQQQVQVTLHEGSFTCHTSSIIDTTCSLGALQSLILPLLVMQVNAELPISSKGLFIDENSILPESSTALRDTLKLLESLIIVDVVRAESLSLGTFSILAHVLQRLGTRVSPEIPQRLGKLCGSISDYQAVFNGSFQALFMSVSLFQACSYVTRRAFIDSMRSMCKVEDVRRSMRALGLMPYLVQVMISCCRSSSAEDKAQRDIIFSFMDFMMVSPIRRDDADAILALVANVAKTDELVVAEHMIEQARFLLLSRPALLRRFLGQLNFTGVLVPLLKFEGSDIVRCEGARMLCSIVLHSKHSQRVFLSSHDDNSNSSHHLTIAANDPTATPPQQHSDGLEDITLGNVADRMRAFPFTPYTYASLRCAATESNQFLSVSMQLPVPDLGPNETLAFAPVLVPLLMLARDAPRDLRVEVLSDLFVLISCDVRAWQTILKLDGWYILVLDVMLADDIGTDIELFGKYRGAGAAPMSPEEMQLEELIDLGIHVLSSILGLAVCSPYHDCEDIDQIIAYVHQIRQDGRVRLISHALQLQILENCALRSGAPVLFSADLNSSPTVNSRASRVMRQSVVLGGSSLSDVEPSGTNSKNISTSNAGDGWAAMSPHRQRSIYNNPIIERNIQQFFYSVEDQFFYTYDVSTALSAQRGDGFVCVDAADTEDQYVEARSRVFMTPLRSAKTGSELLAKSFSNALLSTVVEEAPSITSPSARSGLDTSAAPTGGSFSGGDCSTTTRQSQTLDGTHLIVEHADEWLHADLALMSLQFLSSLVVLVNNSTLPANASSTSESRARRGGVQRIYLRLLRTSLAIAFQDNDFVESVVVTVKHFQSFLDKAVSKFFTSRRSIVDVQDDPPLRSALSIVLILHECILARKRKARSGGRNRFINQQLLVRLKSGVVDNMAVLRELGAFQKPTPAHLDSHHRVGIKTQEWLESSECTDVDEFLEITQRDDYKHLVSLVTDVVRPLEEHSASNIRDLAVRYHSNSVSRTQQTLKHMVLMRQSMIGRVEQFVTSEEAVAVITASIESVLGDANAAKVEFAVIATNWGKFVSRLKGTIWDVDPAEKGTKYVKLCRVEQRQLVQCKMLKDKDGTDHQAITKKEGTNDDDEEFASRTHRNFTVSVRLRQDQAGGLHEADDTKDGLDEIEVETPATTTHSSSPAVMVGFDDATAASSLTSIGDAMFEKAMKLPCELSHLMHCWSSTLVIQDEGTLTVLIDEDNKAYNQIVAKEALPFLHRPRSASSWQALDIVQLAPGRRFRMRRTALEIFFRDRTSILLNFPSTNIMRQTYQVIRRIILAARSDVPREVIFWNENPRKELNKQRLTEQWRHREISNMEYLLALNYLGGRTMNDLTQYPIFPWVVADYDSDQLDLTDPQTFRDLSLPVGLCGGPGRREDIEMRYSEMSSMGDVPFHYFTHYSSPAVVLYFLVRVEPYTTCHVVLQGGRFDVPDRMFHSVVASWGGVTKNIQDVKEMIPECYYLPELYINNNNVRFGLKQDKKPMRDAVLPKWSNNDPYTHVYKMREALECDHVSSQLHQWVDLIFGYKQRGRNAVEALNLFHPHTYELEHQRGNDTAAGGGVSTEDMSSQTAEERNIVIDSLDNIGQTPIQLFVKKHPERKANLAVNPIVDSYTFGFKTIAPQSGFSLDKVAMVRITRSDRIVIVAANGAVFVYRLNKSPVLAKKESTPSRYRLEGVMKKIEDMRAASHSFDTEANPEYRIPPLPVGCMPSVSEAMEWEQSKVTPATGGASNGGGNVSAAPAAGAVILSSTPSSSFGSRDAASTSGRHEPCSWRNTAVVSLGNENALFVIHAGFFDNTCVVRALNVPCEELRFSSHRDRILCLAASDDSRFLVTGGRDTTFIVWSLAFRGRLFVSLLFSICGHEEEPSALALSNQLDVVVTASRDGQWMMHSLSSGKLEQCLSHPEGFSVDFILVQSKCYVPNILIASHVDFKVHQYTVNGALLRSIALPGRLLQWCGSGDPAHAMLLMTPQNVLSTDPASVVFYHSFYLTQTSRVIPTTATEADQQPLAASVASSRGSSFNSVPGNNCSDVWMSCIDAHYNNPQMMVTGTANGNIILMRTEAIR